MTEKKMSTGEVAGHLRAASRIFKAFEFAEEMARLVLTAESSVRKLEKEVESLQKEKEQLNKDCDSIVAKTTKAEGDFTEQQKTIDKFVEKTAKDNTAVMKEARAKAKAIIAKAEEKAAEVEAKTSEAMAAKTAAEVAMRHAESELDAIATRVTQAKESFMEAFG